MRSTRSRISRAGIVAVALTPAIAFAPAAFADGEEGNDTESSIPAELPGSEDSEGSSSEDLDLGELASSLADADLERIAGVLVSLSSGNVSLSTALDVIDLVNGGDQTVGEVISSAAGVIGADAGSAEDVLGSAVADVTGSTSGS
ncbi:MAG TPA: hypothetical protein H9870_11805 [Candidatus Corynebacterium avicola]|uniref:Secreted protein n=1 Tax=Candidatus Corynebacterium avicola TaxID=2838527 RepID=A0A9D1RT63_9CORY|nr:hypothetical protein [Candidatus Corynebacterium avicola]